MSSFIVEGGHRLSGSIAPQGAKNEALEVISAVLLTSGSVTISNIPDILDIRNLISLLEGMGVKVERHSKGEYTFTASRINEFYVSSAEFVEKCARLRGSGESILSLLPENNLHAYKLSAQGPLQGCYMLLDEASVTGTANIVMAATLAKGTTTIYNAACEPYVQQLCKLLVAMGAKIEGIGSNLLKITGVEELHGASHVVLPDMIEVGSFIGMAAINQSELTITNVHYDELGIIPECFRRLGIRLEQRGDDIYIPEQDSYVIESFMDGSIMTIADAPWPGLTPDLLSVMLVTAVQCRGSVLIHQKMFESRLFFVDKLIDMGAQIILCDPHRAVVIGHDHRMQLRGGRMTSPDIRAGIALLLAAMSAKGTSIIDNIDQIDRGYQDIDLRLNALGAHIERQV